MKKLLHIIFLFLYLCQPQAFADGVPDIVPSTSITAPPQNAGPLSPKEAKGAALSKEWMQRNIQPVISEDGKVLFTYGASLPTIVCAPLQLCDLEMQPGERVRDIQVGDKVRWIITPATSGFGSSEITHLNIKPVDAGLSTLLLVTTERRTYHIKLVSKQKDFMPRVGFIYPSEIQKEWDAYFAREKVEQEKATLPGTGQNLANLYFDYEISGSAPWKPLRVYHDGVKTYIQMPKAMSQTKAPVLLLVGSDGENQIVNYRLKGDRYIVDSIFDEAILIVGVGRNQEKVTILRGDSDKAKRKGKRGYDHENY